MKLDQVIFLTDYTGLHHVTGLLTCRHWGTTIANEKKKKKKEKKKKGNPIAQEPAI